jgi:hypothetical protein
VGVVTNFIFLLGIFFANSHCRGAHIHDAIMGTSFTIQKEYRENASESAKSRTRKADDQVPLEAELRSFHTCLHYL